jgi:hypothetical protein
MPAGALRKRPPDERNVGLCPRVHGNAQSGSAIPTERAVADTDHGALDGLGVTDDSVTLADYFSWRIPPSCATAAESPRIRAAARSC